VDARRRGQKLTRAACRHYLAPRKRAAWHERAGEGNALRGGVFAYAAGSPLPQLRFRATRRQTVVLSLLGVPPYRPARSDEAIYQTNNNVEIAGTVQRMSSTENDGVVSL
jgi:hypothetical protein